MKHAIEFLSELKANNNREWFNKHKKGYEEMRKTFTAFTELLINEIRTFDPDLPLIDPKMCMFRIYRDVRFSNDKSPYKTNFGTYIAKEGRKSIYAGYYFHVEPGNCFIGGGCYMPQAEQLKAIRDAIYQTPEEYLEIISNDGFSSIFGEIWGDKVKTYPRGYDKDWQHIELIKNRSYTALNQITDDFLSGDSIMEHTISVFKTLYPFNRFLNEAIKG